MWIFRCVKIFNKLMINFMNKKLFEDIDTHLLYGVKCSESNQVQQDYFERLKMQTELAANNKRYI